MYTIKVFTSLEKSASKKGTFSFTVRTREQVTDHINQLFRVGYRRVLSTDTIEWYPPHVIEKIEATGPGLELGYNDTDITE